MDLSTTYLGMKLRTPLVPSASPSPIASLNGVSIGRWTDHATLKWQSMRTEIPNGEDASVPVIVV
jgi:hypothetical protein